MRHGYGMKVKEDPGNGGRGGGYERGLCLNRMDGESNQSVNGKSGKC